MSIFSSLWPIRAMLDCDWLAVPIYDEEAEEYNEGHTEEDGAIVDVLP